MSTTTKTYCEIIQEAFKPQLTVKYESKTDSYSDIVSALNDMAKKGWTLETTYFDGALKQRHWLLSKTITTQS